MDTGREFDRVEGVKFFSWNPLIIPGCLDGLGCSFPTIARNFTLY